MKTRSLVSVLLAAYIHRNMVRMKSRTQFPPHGWLFIDSPISDQPLGDLSWDFERLCQQVQAQRVANPRFKLNTDLNHIREEVDNFNALRMQSIRGADIYVTADTGNAPNFPQPQRQARLRAAAGAVKKLKAGLGLIEAWEAAGYPAVTPEQATMRAAVCATCPKNELGHYTRWFTVPASEHIMKRAAKLREMKLTTPLDDQLGTCAACLCVMTAKVHVPIDFIKEHQVEGVAEELDPRCWILHEQV